MSTGIVFGTLAAEWVEKIAAANIPEEFRPLFTVVELGEATPFGSISWFPVCNRCGALVYVTALDRHVTFHDSLKVAPEPQQSCPVEAPSSESQVY